MTAQVPVRVRVWNEGVHEATGNPASMATHYPHGMHGAIALGLAERLPAGSSIHTAVLSDPEHGLSESALAETDVLLWWGHIAHAEVSDEVVDRVHRHVLAGMGLIVLHSGHFSKILTRLLGTTCSLAWRDDGDREVVWTVAPAHPIAAGVPNPFVIPAQETYGEYFDVPAPDELIFISSFSGGEVFRSGLTYQRGLGRIFYFSPGDQDYPVYQQDEVKTVLANGVMWAFQAGLARSIPAVSHTTSGWFAAPA